MGQWGAFGYAVNSQWTYSQILNHYYGSLAAGGTTTLGAMPNGWTDTATNITVSITATAGLDVIVTSASAYTVTWGGGSLNMAAHSGVRFHLTAGNSGGSSATYEVDTSPTSGGCGGPWTQVAAGVSNPTAVPGPEPFPSDGSLTSEVLELCEPGANVWLRGTIGATANSDGAARTVNVLPLQQYLADVTPSESPTSWAGYGGSGPQGEPWGFQALEAQAVAARSYLMSGYPGGYGGYADICESTACQYYPGVLNENSTTDAAVTGTANTVVLGGSTVERTEYSSSTGGYSAPGTFAAVVDDGDSVCLSNACNSNHTWSATISVSGIQKAYPSIGTLTGVDVTQRNTYGDWGGRVLQMTLHGTSDSVNLTGDQFAAAFGLKSDWFTVLNQASGGVGGYWAVASDGGIFSYGNAGFYGSMGGKYLAKPMVGMAPTSDQGGYWTVASDGGIFSFGDAGFYGSMGGKYLAKPMVGMASPNSGGYWTVASDGGIFSFGAVGFYGSMGGKTLWKPVVGMAATPDGGGYWEVASDGGIFTFGDGGFYGSMGGKTLWAPIVGMAPTSDGRGYWLLGADGGVFTFGDATYQGSLPGDGIKAGAVAIVPTHTGNGYLIVTADGQVVPFGDAPWFGQPSTASPWYPMVGGAAVSS